VSRNGTRETTDNNNLNEMTSSRRPVKPNDRRGLAGGTRDGRCRVPKRARRCVIYSQWFSVSPETSVATRTVLHLRDTKVKKKKSSRDPPKNRDSGHANGSPRPTVRETLTVTSVTRPVVFRFVIIRSGSSRDRKHSREFDDSVRSCTYYIFASVHARTQ